MNGTKEVGDAAYHRSVQLSQRVEDSGLKEQIMTKSSQIIDKSFELGAVAYLKTCDKLKEINVSGLVANR